MTIKIKNNMEILTILKWALVIFVLYSVAKTAVTDSSIAFTKSVVAHFNLYMFFRVLTVLAWVICISLLLYQTIPFTQWSWSQAVFGESINITFAPLHTGDALLNVVLGVPLIMLCIVAIPKLAYAEENVFRKDVITWKAIVGKSLLFGLIHCIVGVPLSAGIALSFAGLFLAYIYRREYLAQLHKLGLTTQDGKVFDVHPEYPLIDKDILTALEEANKKSILVSTSYHTMWNWTIIVVLLVLMLIEQGTQ